MGRALVYATFVAQATVILEPSPIIPEIPSAIPEPSPVIPEISSIIPEPPAIIPQSPAVIFEPLEAVVAAALRGDLDEPRARQLYARGAEAVIFVLVAMARRLVEPNARWAEPIARWAEPNARLAGPDARLIEQDTRLAEFPSPPSTSGDRRLTPSTPLPKSFAGRSMTASVCAGGPTFRRGAIEVAFA